MWAPNCLIGVWPLRGPQEKLGNLMFMPASQA
jgi:hypothetical protein